jgi:hypothetical protein
MTGVSTQDLARALEERGVGTRITGPDSVWTKVGEDYQAELQLKGVAWWLHTPAMGEATPVAKVVGKATTSEVDHLADRVVSLMRQHWPIRLAGAMPVVQDIPVVNAEASGPLAEIADALSGPTGLTGRLRWEDGPGWAQILMTGGFGSLRVSTDGDDYFLDLTPTGGTSHTFVVGRVGDERGAARRVVATVRALVPDPRRVLVPDPIGDLHKVLEHLPDRLNGQVARSVDRAPWLDVPGSSATRAASIFILERLVLGELRGDLFVFGSLGSISAAEIASEVMSRLTCSPEERDYAAVGWADDAPQLFARLQRTAEELSLTEDSPVVRSARARVVQGQQQLSNLASRGGIEALHAAQRLVDELEGPGHPSSASPPPSSRPVRHWADAEEAAAAWMEWFGFGPAQVCGGPGDGGVDVRAPGAVAQVKDYGSPIAAGPVRELAGVASVDGVQPLFFARSGYTKDAVEFGDRAGIALFQFDLQGSVTASNSVATRLLSGRI